MLHEILCSKFLRNVIKSLQLRSARLHISKGIIILGHRHDSKIWYISTILRSVKLQDFLAVWVQLDLSKDWHEPWCWAVYCNQSLILFLTNAKSVGTWQVSLCFQTLPFQKPIAVLSLTT